MRTFVAIEVTDQQVIDSVKKFQTELGTSARPVEPKNLHFTLEFLGEVSGKTAHKVIEALGTIEFSKFEVSLNGVGAFPKPESPKVIWIGTDESGGRLMAELAKKVKDTLKPLGFRSERPFRPHLTVLRVKKKIVDMTEKLKKQQDTYFGKQDVVRIKLKKSELTLSGPNYSDLLEVKAI